MRVGLFRFTGAWDDRTIDHARQLLALPGPWWVLASHHRRGARINIFDDDRPWAGIYLFADNSIHLPPGHDRRTLAHEVAHGIDQIALDRDDRSSILEAWQVDPDPRAWGGGGLPHSRRPSEGFAQWFAWWCGWREQPFYGPHRWDDPAVAGRIEGIVMAAADRTSPFVDDDQIADVHRPAVLWAAGQGLLQGDGDRNVDPKAPVTREQLASILHRYDQTRG